MVQHTRKYQFGQAFPLGLALLAAGCLGALVLFNTGQVATDKARLANAADAAAYSGLVWQARAMNFQAYANRAMVANQVSIGQAVTLNSWTNYGAKTAGRINMVLGGVPYVGAFTNVMNQVMTGINQVVSPISQAIVSVVDKINTGLGISQEAVFASSFAATPDVVRKLVAATDPRFDVDTAYSLAGMMSNLDGWNDFTDSFESDDTDDMKERGAVIVGSRDDFTRARNWKFIKNLWIYTTPLTKHKLFREGQTHLAMHEIDGEMKWEWMAKDTLSFQTVLIRPWRVGGSKKKWSEAEIGWGEAYANDEDGRSRVLEECRYRDQAWCAYVNRNDDAERAADSEKDKMRGYSGVQAYRSLSVATRENEHKDPKLRLRIEVALPAERTKTADEWVSEEPFGAPVSAYGNVVSSVSVAEVHYRRPDAYRRLDADRVADPDFNREEWESRKRESANGYNPYWDVRLAPVSAVDRLGAVAARTLGGDSGSVPPGEGELPDYDQVGDGLANGIGDVADTAGSGLGTYAGTLADAYGVDVNDLSIASVSLDDIENLALRDPVEQIREGIEEVIEDAVSDIINAIVDDVTERAQSEVDAAVANFPGGEAVQGWTNDAIALNEKFEAIQEQVKEDFGAALEDGIRDFNVSVQPFVDGIESKRQELETYEERLNDEREYAEEVAQGFRDDIAELEADIVRERDELVNLLHGRMLDIIRERSEGAAWALELTDTLTTESIRTILDDYFENATAEGEEGLEELLTWSVD